ncbi:DUF6233 domain-containing protein [Streptomyces violascens]|uniref:DUF6233 domain-containing protein n=1 Tax=Streptomyces violascens TaxID=67381 RepID=UPI00364D1055
MPTTRRPTPAAPAGRWAWVRDGRTRGRAATLHAEGCTMATDRARPLSTTAALDALARPGTAACTGCDAAETTGGQGGSGYDPSIRTPTLPRANSVPSSRTSSPSSTAWRAPSRPGQEEQSLCSPYRRGVGAPRTNQWLCTWLQMAFVSDCGRRLLTGFSDVTLF